MKDWNQIKDNRGLSAKEPLQCQSYRKGTMELGNPLPFNFEQPACGGTAVGEKVGEKKKEDSNEATKKARGGVHESVMRSADFLAKSDEEKYGYIGKVLDKIQGHQMKTDKLLSDVSHSVLQKRAG